VLSAVGLSNGTIKSAVLALALPEMAVGLVQGVLFWRGCNLRLLAVASICVGGCMIMGLEILLVLSDSALIWTTRGLGMLLLLLAIDSACQRRPAELHGQQEAPSELPEGSVPDFVRDRHALITAVACFCGSGLLGGLTGVAGPPLMLYVRWSRTLHKKTWRATSAVLRFGLSSCRLAYLLGVGALKIDSWPAVGSHAAVVAAALVGLALGNWLSNRCLDSQTQHRIILLLLLSGSLLLATTQVQPVEEVVVWGVVGAMALGCVLILAHVWPRWLWRHPNRPSSRTLRRSLLASDAPPSLETTLSGSLPVVPATSGSPLSSLSAHPEVESLHATTTNDGTGASAAAKTNAQYGIHDVSRA